MALSKCGSCGGGFFETQPIKPNGSAFTLLAIQCASCGAVVGITERHNVPALIGKQNAVINIMARQMGIASNLETA